MTAEERFHAFCVRKTHHAVRAMLAPLVSVEDLSADRGLVAVGNTWTRRMYDGPFHLSPLPRGVPAVSLVFVQSRDGNTVAKDPADLGGGDVDMHLLYEGLTRVAADGVLAGAGTALARDVFFSVWHPEIVALRGALGLPRHPAQIVVSSSGRYDPARLLAYEVPAAPVFIITSNAARPALAAAAAGRPWVRVVGMGDGGLTEALQSLRSAHGITRISAIGGPTVATALVDAALVQDLYLTTTSVGAGEPGSPFYVGPRSLAFETIVAKHGAGAHGPIRFEHVALGRPQGPPLRLRRH